MAIPLAMAAAAGHPALGVPAAIGAFITGFTSLQGIYRTRLAAVLVSAIGMSVTTFVGAIASHSLPGLIAATAVAAYVFATLGQIGPIASTVGLNSFVAFILFSSQPLTTAAAASDSALVVGGGLVQALLLFLAWPAARLGAERAALADVYRNLAVYARAVADRAPSLPPITPFATARQVLRDPQPFAHAAEMARLGRLLEDSETVRKRLGALAATQSSGGMRPPMRTAIREIAAQLDSVADVLRCVNGEAAVGEVAATGDEAAAGTISDLAVLARDAIAAAALISSGRLPRFALLSKAKPQPYVSNRLDWFARDSLRFAIVLAVAMAAGRHFAADRGYWIPLTAALVLKPDFQSTFVRGFARIGGTLVGAAVATLVLAAIGSNAVFATIGILVASAAAYLTFNPNYALFTVAITSFVTIVLHSRGMPASATIDARLLDTLAGGALAMIGYLVLPSSEHARSRVLLADLMDTQRRLAGAILDAYANPSTANRKTVETARTDAWKARTAAEASIDRARHEPHRQHTINTARALRILSASQRFALANLALEAALETQPQAPPAGLHNFAQALDERMTELAAALRESRRVPLDDRVDTAIEELDHGPVYDADPSRRFIVERLHAYAQAVSKIARLIGVGAAS